MERFWIVVWILLGGAFLAASKVSRTNAMRRVLFLVALACWLVMFAVAYDVI